MMTFEKWYARQSSTTQLLVDRGNGQLVWDAALAEARDKVLSEIESSTGPTGGWIHSPKALAASIALALEPPAKGDRA